MTACSLLLPAAHLLTLWRGKITQPFSSSEYRVKPFDRAVLSWNCDGPAIFELEANGVRHCMGCWSKQPRSADANIDTLVLRIPARLFRFHVRPQRGTTVTLVAVTHWIHNERRAYSRRRSHAWGTVLAVPQRSQFAERKDAARICSPTSLAMVLEFHGAKKATRAVAAGVYDHAARMYGNWPFNTAYAHSAAELETFVCRGSSIADLEREIAAGRPVIVSHSWRNGDLDGAPLPESKGHLIVVAGFTPDGDVVVNDPAGKPVRCIYKRRQLYTTWLERGQGIMYVMHPTNTPR